MLRNKLEPYLGKQKTDAKKYLNKNPLNLSNAARSTAC